MPTSGAFDDRLRSRADRSPARPRGSRARAAAAAAGTASAASAARADDDRELGQDLGEFGRHALRAGGPTSAVLQRRLHPWRDHTASARRSRPLPAEQCAVAHWLQIAFCTIVNRADRNASRRARASPTADASIGRAKCTVCEPRDISDRDVARGTSNAHGPIDMRTLRLTSILLASLPAIAAAQPAPADPNTPAPVVTPTAPATPVATPAPDAPPAEAKPDEELDPFTFADFTWQSGNARTQGLGARQQVLHRRVPARRRLPLQLQPSEGRHDRRLDRGVASAARTRSPSSASAATSTGTTSQGRMMTQFGQLSTTTPRNDASPARGQWQLDDAYRYISEAYGGYHFGDPHRGVNLQAGIFMSYIGLWSYYNFDNWTYQPSYVSSNTPWFFNGARLQWFPTDQLKIEPWLINGWQSYGKFNTYARRRRSGPLRAERQPHPDRQPVPHRRRHPRRPGSPPLPHRRLDPGASGTRTRTASISTRRDDADGRLRLRVRRRRHVQHRHDDATHRAPACCSPASWRTSARGTARSTR